MKYVVEGGKYFREHFWGKYPELLEMVEHINDRWSNMPPAVEATYDAFFENEDYWSDQPQYRWSTPYLWSEKGTA